MSRVSPNYRLNTKKEHFIRKSQNQWVRCPDVLRFFFFVSFFLVKSIKYKERLRL